MKILEVRDGFIKFESDAKIDLSAFIRICGDEKDYIAQITQIKENSDGIICFAKILFLLTEEGLSNYDKTLPPADSEIVEFTSDILCNSINVSDPIIAGKTLSKELNITIDSSAFNKKMLICTDSEQSNNTIVKNLTKQFKNLGKKVVIIDTLGVINAHKYTAGIDFKLPLNTDSLAFMYKDCLDEATADSKSLIVDIFKDLSEYSKTVPFVPFGTLRSIVNDMVDSSHVFKLFVLKTKLNKLNKLGYFADKYSDVKILNNILSNECVIIDLSKLEAPFQNEFLMYLYSSLDSSETQVILELSNLITKRSIKSIYSDRDIATTFVTNSNFKYINDIKNIFDNFIIEPSGINNKTFDIYSTFLNSMPESAYLIAGEATNYIPLVSALIDIDDLPLIEKHLSDTTEVLDSDISFDSNNKTVDTSEIIANIDEKSKNAIEEVAENLKTPNKLSLFDDETDETEEPDTEFAETTEEDIIDEPDLESENNEIEEPNTELNDSEGSIEEEILDELENEENNIETEPVAAEQNSDNESFEDDENDTEYETVVTQNISEEPEYPIESEEKIDTTPLDDNKQEEYVEDEPEISDNIEATEQKEDTLEEDNAEETPIIIDDSIDIDFDETEEDKIQDEYTEISEETPITVQAEESDDETNHEFNNEDVISLTEDDDSDLEEIVELDANDIQEDDIIVDFNEPLNELPNNAEEQIIKDVDKVFTTRKDDDITDTDLDLIDELNNNEEIILEDNEIGEILGEENDKNDIITELPAEEDSSQEIEINSEILEKRDSSTPIVPVYNADIPEEDMVMSDPIQQGDSVVHAKYGSGVVEKMIKYGNKTLFAINFDNVGRRLLDPTLTEIKKS